MVQLYTRSYAEGYCMIYTWRKLRITRGLANPGMYDRLPIVGYEQQPREKSTTTHHQPANATPVTHLTNKKKKKPT